MSYVLQPGGSIEYFNEEPGSVWLQRMLEVYGHAAWLNPLPEAHWNYTPSIQMIEQLVKVKDSYNCDTLAIAGTLLGGAAAATGLAAIG